MNGLECPAGTVPGWLDEQGLPTSCVGDEPIPGLPPTGIGDPLCINADGTDCDALPLTPAPMPIIAIEPAPTEAVVVVPSTPPELAYTGPQDPTTVILGALLVIGGIVALLSSRRTDRSNVKPSLTEESRHPRGGA